LKCASPTLFLCQPTGQCLQSKYRCDGRSQCSDGSDEIDCAPCDRLTHIECLSDSTCIDKSLQCNGHEDCSDGSDEAADCGTMVTSFDSRNTTTLPYAIGIGIVGGILVLAIAVSLAVCVCRQKARQQVVLDDRNNIVMVAKASLPATIAISDDRSGSSLFSAPLCGILPPPPSTVSLYKSNDGGSESPLYDREHITGASSSSLTTTAVQNYPKQTLNPPPSPVTERSRSVARERRYAEAPVPKRHTKARLYSKRRRKHRIPPPPTTPCSTDVCEDSEPYLGDIGGPGGYSYYVIGGSGCCYESDPLCPPPPTPHSQYLSEELSCPPSPPSTERSYFISYPPPPPSSVFSFTDSQDC
jgi:low density lipoprotein receptor-related protein 5/6